MNKIDWKVIVLLGIILSIIIGFAYGSGFLGGEAPVPGSEDDPLVSQSYADKSIDDKVATLEAQVEEMTLKIQVLENDLLELYTMVNKTPSKTGVSSNTNSNTSSNPPVNNSGTSTGGDKTTVSTNNIGKKATIGKDNNVVNLRKNVGTTSEILKKLTKDDSFTITKVNLEEEWYQVQLTDGTIGWVAGFLVAVE